MARFDCAWSAPERSDMDDYGTTVDADWWSYPVEEWDDTLPFALPVDKPRPAVSAIEMPLAYVSGPYRHNIRQAEAVAVELWKMGYAVICPHTNTRHFDGPIDADTFIRGDIEMVKRCDVLIKLPNWHRSEGAKLEVKAAIAAKVLVLSWEMDRALIEHLPKHGMEELPSYARS